MILSLQTATTYMNSLPVFLALGFRLITISKKKAFFSFDTPQTIQQIILYGNSNLDSRVLEGTITLNNGFTTKFGPLKEGSKATIVDFISQHNIS